MDRFQYEIVRLCQVEALQREKSPERLLLSSYQRVIPFRRSLSTVLVLLILILRDFVGNQQVPKAFEPLKPGKGTYYQHQYRAPAVGREPNRWLHLIYRYQCGTDGGGYPFLRPQISHLSATGHCVLGEEVVYS
jgi:hypothetical protein